jgi:hypothetical protein
MIERRHIKIECEKSKLDMVRAEIDRIHSRLKVTTILDNERLYLASKLRHARRRRIKIWIKLNSL